MKARYGINDIKHINGRPIFFDANIIIYLFWATSSNRSAPKRYSSLFSSLIGQGNPLFLNTHVISEVINRELRVSLEFQNYKANGHNDFKAFRDTQDGQKVQEDIFSIVHENILTTFSLTECTINNDELSKLLIVDTLDFTDKLIVDVCKKNDMILLTHDSDFNNSDIEILSANPKLYGHPSF